MVGAIDGAVGEEAVGGFHLHGQAAVPAAETAGDPVARGLKAIHQAAQSRRAWKVVKEAVTIKRNLRRGAYGVLAA